MAEQTGFFAEFGAFLGSASQAASETIASVRALDRQLNTDEGDFMQTISAPSGGEDTGQAAGGLDMQTLLLIGGAVVIGIFAFRAFK